jgi:hypothetical protein
MHFAISGYKWVVLHISLFAKWSVSAIRVFQNSGTASSFNKTVRKIFFVEGTVGLER